MRLPDSAILQVGDVFMSCPNLSKFEVKDTNIRYNVDGRGVLYSEDGKTVIAAPCKLSGTYVVQDGTELIGAAAFRGCQLSGAVLPSSTVTLSRWAFASCDQLRCVEAPGVKIIMKNAFGSVELKEFYAPSLETVAADAFKIAVFYIGTKEISCDSDEFKNIGYWSGTEAGKMYAGVEVSGIRYCKADGDDSAVQAVSCGEIKDAVIPDTVTIGMTSHRVTSINGLLQEMPAIETISIGANVTGIDVANDFDGLQELKSISVSADNASYASFGGAMYSKDLKTLLRYPVAGECPVSFAPGVETIGDSAFYDCKHTAGIVLPLGVKSVESNAFGSDINDVLGSFTLPASLEDFDDSAFDIGFYDGDTEITAVEDIRGYSWILNDAKDRYVRGITVPEPDNGNVSFDAPHLFELDDATISKIGGNALTVTMDNGTVSFSAEAVAGLKAGVLTIGAADISGYPEGLKEKIGDRPVYTILFGDNKEFAGTVTVSLPYEPKDGESASGIYAAYVDTETGELAEMKGTYSDGYVTFTTGHFSDFAVMYSEPDSGDGGSGTMLYVGIAVAVAAVVLILVLYLMHLGPFARKD